MSNNAAHAIAKKPNQNKYLATDTTQVTNPQLTPGRTEKSTVALKNAEISDSLGKAGFFGQHLSGCFTIWDKPVEPMSLSNNRFLQQLLASLMDLTPILLTVVLFQVFVIQQPLPEIGQLLSGMLCTIFGLTLFTLGLELALFPIGEEIAYSFARKGSLFWLLTFAFCLGFGTTIAEPALIAVANKAAQMAHPDNIDTSTVYAFGLRTTVAISVGCAIILGVLRILRGWPLQHLILGGYCLVLAITPFAPANIIGIAYDAGGVTTSTITVPLVTALGIGLASSIKGRNPVTDGFGLIALASLTPIIFVLLFGIAQ